MGDVIVSTTFLTAALDEMYMYGSMYLKLFCNDYEPAADMVPGDFTEASGGGDAMKAVESTTDFTQEYDNEPPDIIMAEQTFTFTGVLTTNPSVYGWFLISEDLSLVLVAKELDTPYTPASGGGTLKFTPRIQAGNGTPA
jgi:hypothetical protein